MIKFKSLLFNAFRIASFSFRNVSFSLFSFATCCSNCRIRLSIAISKIFLLLSTIPACTWYPETEFCYLTNKSGWFLATKGGFNNESHNHNDVGTFSLYVNTIPVLIDAGVGTYTRQTFSSERYTIWTMQSNYHNLPMINGVPQSFGQNYKATDVVCQPKKRFLSERSRGK